MGEFARLAKAAAAERTWEEKLQEQQKRLGEFIPSSEQEATSKALANIAKFREDAFRMGYGARLRKHMESGTESLLEDPTLGVPGREVVIDLPATKRGWYDPRLRSKEAGILSPLIDPAVETAEDLYTGARNKAEEKLERLTRTTSDPTTLPWYAPHMALSAPTYAIEGYRQAEKDRQAQLLAALEKRVESSRKEFDKALKEEYTLSRKQASAGEVVDLLARFHVKRAEGGLNQALGYYLALAALAAKGTHMATKDWVESRDPRHQYASALKELVKERMRQNPPPIQVATEEVPEFEESKEVRMLRPEPEQEDKGI
jgi:hypothetical protein